jgi:hypothetical protein
MQRERWSTLYRLAQRLGQPQSAHQRFSTAWIAAVFFWAVICGQPVSWACLRENWPPELLGRRILPDQSTMSRRLRLPETQQLLCELANAMRRRGRQPRIKIIDAKPLPIGGYSKDPDARWGRAAGAQGKGYKLYTIIDDDAVPLACVIKSMNVSEKKTAVELMQNLTGSGVLLGDSCYDASYLYDEAVTHNHLLIAPRARPNAGLGHHPNSPYRLLSMVLLKSHLGKAIHNRRVTIERFFAHLTNFSGGLGPLPQWVRRLHRVTLWVQTKLLINAVRILKNRGKLPLAFA